MKPGDMTDIAQLRAWLQSEEGRAFALQLGGKVQGSTLLTQAGPVIMYLAAPNVEAIETILSVVVLASENPEAGPPPTQDEGHNATRLGLRFLLERKLIDPVVLGVVSALFAAIDHRKALSAVSFALADNGVQLEAIEKKTDALFDSIKAYMSFMKRGSGEVQG